MTDTHLIQGVAATLPTANLDTDQIMPKQFLRGIDKAGLDQGLQPFGIQAVIASSFGEIFYANAMNNWLMVVILPEDAVQALMDEAGRSPEPLPRAAVREH